MKAKSEFLIPYLGKEQNEKGKICNNLKLII